MDLNPRHGTGDGTVRHHVVQLPGMKSGSEGDAFADQPGPTIRNITIPAWQFIGVEVLWNFLRVFFGLLTVDGMGLAELAPPGDAMSHVYNIAGISLVPTLLALGQELYSYLSKVRQASQG